MKAKYLLFVVLGLAVTLFFINAAIHPGARLGNTASSQKRPNWPDKPFTIGPPSDYAKPGVYYDFAKSHGVYIVSHRGMIVALSVNDPFNHRPTRYENTINQFIEPNTRHRFTTNGLVTGAPSHIRKILNDREAVRKMLDEKKPIPRSLERCHIKLKKNDEDESKSELRVDPRHRFIHEMNQWSRQYSGYLLGAKK